MMPPCSRSIQSLATSRAVGLPVPVSNVGRASVSPHGESSSSAVSCWPPPDSKFQLTSPPSPPDAAVTPAPSSPDPESASPRLPNGSPSTDGDSSRSFAGASPGNANSTGNSGGAATIAAKGSDRGSLLALGIWTFTPHLLHLPRLPANCFPTTIRCPFGHRKTIRSPGVPRGATTRPAGWPTAASAASRPSTRVSMSSSLWAAARTRSAALSTRVRASSRSRLLRIRVLSSSTRPLSIRVLSSSLINPAPAVASPGTPTACPAETLVYRRPCLLTAVAAVLTLPYTPPLPGGHLGFRATPCRSLSSAPRVRRDSASATNTPAAPGHAPSARPRFRFPSRPPRR